MSIVSMQPTMNLLTSLGDVLVYEVCNDGIQISEVEYMLAGEIELLLVVFLQRNLSQNHLLRLHANTRYVRTA